MKPKATSLRRSIQLINLSEDWSGKRMNKQSKPGMIEVILYVLYNEKIRKHYELLYDNKFNNLDDIDKFMKGTNYQS